MIHTKYARLAAPAALFILATSMFAGNRANVARDRAARNPDTSSNATLSGTYFIRQILLSDFDGKTGLPGRIRSVNGPLVFDGKGGYSFGGRIQDSKAGGQSKSYNTSGQYGVSSNGAFYIQSLIDSNDTDFGGVGAVGPSAFVASATEGGNQDFIIGIPTAASVAMSTLTGTYRAAYIDCSQGDLTKVRDASFTLSPNGQGSLGSVAVNGSAADMGNTAISQTVSGATYSVATPPGPFGGLNFGPASSSKLISGNKIFAMSPDGNLLLAADPDGYDILVATRPFSGGDPNGSYSGTYYYAGINIDNSNLPANTTTSNDYGSINATGTPVALLHQRYFEWDLGVPYDFTYSSNSSFDSTGSLPADVGTEFLGAGAQTIMGVGGKSFYSVFIGLRGKQYTGSGTFLYPTAVVNGANFAPITNSIAPGEYITVFGSGLAPDTFPQAGQSLPVPFPTTLGGVQITVNGRNAPMFFVSPTQISFIAPFATGGTTSNPEPYAAIQVINNGTRSNTVSVRVSRSAPGVWTSGANGISIARVQKLPDFSIVSESNPVRPGDNIVIYCTGLGKVTPAPADGVPASSTTLSNVDLSVYATIDGQPSHVAFAGLSPGFVALYQINAVVPRNVTRGQSVSLDIETDDKDGTTALTSEAKLPIAALAGNIVATFSPNPVAVGTDGKWHYNFTLQENGGVGVTVKTMVINGTDMSSRIAEFFGSAHVAANGRLTTGVVSSGYTPPADSVWQFTGTDDNGAALSWSATVHLQ
jgi:uncharacterized protein (TIGR03437 family)